MSTALETRVWRKERIAKGLCVTCNEPLVPGRRHCAKHLAYYAEYGRKLRAKRRQRGLCKVCGEKALPKRTICAVCHRSESENKRRFRQQRATAGLCTECGKRKAAAGLKACIQCSKFHAKRIRESRRKHRLIQVRSLEFRRLFAGRRESALDRLAELIHGSPL